MGDMDPDIWTPYCGVAPTPATYLERWNLDPLVLGVLLVLLILLLRRSDPARRGLAVAAVAVLVVSFVSPLCALSSALFSARTVHHVLLVAAAAPLLAWRLPGRRVGPLAVATLVPAAVFWFWHAPDAYAAALSNDGLYWVMQLSLLGSATWFWMAVRTASAPAAIAALLVSMVLTGLLGALLTFAGAPLYAPHQLTSRAFGLKPLEDQQIAGLIMWAPAAAIYMVAALTVLGRRLAPDGSGAGRTA